MDPSAGNGPTAARARAARESGGSAYVPPTEEGSRGPHGQEPPVSDVFFDAARRLTAHLLDLRTDALRLIKARRDRVQVRARAIAFQAATLGVLAVFGIVTLGVAAWLLLAGLAGALNALFETAPWVGSLVVGFAVPVLALLTIFMLRRSGEKAQLKALMEEYRDLERRRDMQDRPSGRAGSPDASDPAAKTPHRPEGAARAAAAGPDREEPRP